jgi:thiol-disulfide isomerase/thioredoxin
MKKLLYFAFISLALISCSESNDEPVSDDPNTPQEENFKVYGTVEGASNTSIFLEAMSEKGTIQVAEAKTDADGEFKMIGNIPGLGIYQLRLGEASDKIIPLTLVPKDNLKVESSYNDFGQTPVLSGTEWSQTMTEYMALFTEFAKKQEALSAQQGKMVEEDLMTAYKALRKPMDAYSKKKMKADPGNPINIILSTSLTPNMGFKEWDVENMVILKKVSEAYQKRFKDSPVANTIANQVFQIESAYTEYVAFNSGDKIAPEIALKNPAGKEVTLSSLRGKYVLIDFWASWCKPCRLENPNVVRLYNEYKDKGFTIFSVSLDNNADAWKMAIESDGLIWPNHGSDLLAWNTPLVQTYGFQGIPYTVLIDKEGKIIETGLRGTALERKLKELLPN